MSQYSTNLTDKQWQVTEKHRLKKILADGWYKGRNSSTTSDKSSGRSSRSSLGPTNLPKSSQCCHSVGIVEESFSWIKNFRRLSMDYDFHSDTGVAMVQLAFCQLMYNKIRD